MNGKLTNEEEKLLRKLRKQIDEQRPEDARNLRYYRGIQDIGTLGISVPPAMQEFAFPLNWCRTYVDSITERQDVRLIIRRGAAAEDEELRRDWEYNNLATESVIAHTDLLVYGRSFISVSANPTGDRPLIRVEDPRSMAAIVDPVSRSMVAALRLYRTDVGLTQYATMYLPNETILIDYQSARPEVTERIVHNLGRVPVVMMLNRKRSGEWKGETQLTDLKPLVDMSGRVVLQLQLAMETTATPQKVALGATEKDFTNEDGEQVQDPWDLYLGAMLMLPNKDAKVLQLEGARMDGFHQTIKMLAEQASTVTGLPVRLMGQNTANPASEGAIRADENRLVKQVERINAVAGAGWSWALGIAERIRTRQWSDGNIAIEWHNPMTPTVAQRADALQKLTGGKPVLSVRGAMNELGWSQARIDKELEWLADEEDEFVRGYGDAR